MRTISLALASLAYFLPIALTLWIRFSSEPLHGMFVLANFFGVLVLTMAASAVATALRVAAQKDLPHGLPASSAGYRVELVLVAAPMVVVAVLGLAVVLGHAA